MTLMVLTVLAGACATAPRSDASQTEEEAGARIWRATCARCHSRRLPQEHGPAAWGVIVRHMRTIADLSKPEADAVEAFLRQASARSERDHDGPGPLDPVAPAATVDGR